MSFDGRQMALIEKNKNSNLIYCEIPIDEFKPDDSFHIAMKPIATFVQFCCLMPVTGISYNNPKILRFKWTSYRVIFTLIYIGYGAFTSILFFTFIYDLGISTKNIGENFERFLNAKFLILYKSLKDLIK